MNPVDTLCQICNIPLVQVRTSRKYCRPCAENIRREQCRASARKFNAMKRRTHSVKMCCDCGKSFESSSVSHKRCSECKKSRACRVCGIEMPRPRLVYCSLKCKAEWQRRAKPVTRDELHLMYTIQGLSTYDIGKIYNRDSTRVHDWLRDFNIPTRRRGENLKKGQAVHNYGVNNCINSFAGKHHTTETRQNLSAQATGRPNPKIQGEKNGMAKRKGSLSPLWRGGHTPHRLKVYATYQWRRIDRLVRKRDVVCQRCGGSESALAVHHTKGFDGTVNVDTSDLVLLCKSCHDWVHSRKNLQHTYLVADYWIYNNKSVQEKYVGGDYATRACGG